MNADVPPVSTLLALTDQTVIVTGASGHIGAGIALRLAEAGSRVAVHYRRGRAAAERVVDRIVAQGGVAAAFGGDLSVQGVAEELIDKVLQSLGPVDGLVNNGGIQPVEPFLGISDEALSAMLQTNLGGPFALTKAFALRQRNRGVAGGSVVNIASIEGLQPAVGHSHYASSKAALIMMTKAAALELGPQRIRVNAVCPGLIRRDGLEQDWPKGVERYRSAAPLGRLGDVSEVADAVLFLLSSASRWVSGSVLVVDGGVSCAPTW